MKKVRLVEVGPRDGLQNEPLNIRTDQKIEFINRLSETGLTSIEVTSFVSPKWIPQLSDNTEVFCGIKKNPQVHYSALVPNEIGMHKALEAGVKEIAVFSTVSETFSQKNTHCSIEESLSRIQAIAKLAASHNIVYRGYISCAWGCPFEGKIPEEKVIALASRLLDMGCYEISLGDTIGIATPNKAVHLIETLIQKIPVQHIAIHFHDTYGQALANIYACLQLGISVIDTAIGGLGGCPYARGASGNVATEDVVYLLKGLNIETGIHLEKLLEVSRFIEHLINRPLRSKVAQALNG